MFYGNWKASSRKVFPALPSPNWREGSVFAFDSPVCSFLPHSDCVDDQVHIEQLEIFAHIGVPDDERASAQRLTFTMSLWPLEEFHRLEDQIARTVDYAAVCGETKKFVDERRDRLIETLADALARHLLEKFEIRKITVELRKYVLPETEFVSVTVTRDRFA